MFEKVVGAAGTATCHWYVYGPLPPGVTEKATEVLSGVVFEAGCVAMVTALQGVVTYRVAMALESDPDPHPLDIFTRNCDPLSLVAETDAMLSAYELEPVSVQGAVGFARRCH
jgi:hypothetical protein